MMARASSSKVFGVWVKSMQPMPGRRFFAFAAEQAVLDVEQRFLGTAVENGTRMARCEPSPVEGEGRSTGQAYSHWRQPVHRFLVHVARFLRHGDLEARIICGGLLDLAVGQEVGCW